MDEQNEKKENTKVCKYCQSEISKKARICPVCKKKQGNKWGAVLIVFSVLLLIGAVFGGGDDSSNKSSSTSNTEQSAQATPEPIEYITVSAAQLQTDLRNNALNASDTYKDHYLELTGSLFNIDSSGKYIQINTGASDYSFIYITCYLNSDEQREIVSKLNTYDTITIKGKCFEVGEVVGYGIRIEEIVTG